MPEPVDTAADLLETRAGQIERVAVESLDPQAASGSDVLGTATNVRAIAGRETGGETGAGNGGVIGQTRRNFTLVAADVVGFELKNRDRITTADGRKWITGDVNTGGFGALYEAKDCVLER